MSHKCGGDADPAASAIARSGSAGGPLRTRLMRHAQIVERIRRYFAAAGVIEVRTPLVVRHATTEPTIRNLELARDAGPRFLRTSPEAALKQLVGQGAGDVYELGTVFRAEETGRLHREEFTLLEWYRVGFDHHRLMDDVAALLAACGLARTPVRWRYADLFAEVYGPDPHALTNSELARLATDAGLSPGATEADDRAFLFDALYALGLEQRLATHGAVLLHAFPAELRAYARLAPTPPYAAERFELIIDGIEIANGYHEVVDADEQAACFARDNTLRRRRELPPVIPDADWLAALAAGMPPCAGVALGIDRLLMVLEGVADIAAVRVE